MKIAIGTLVKILPNSLDETIKEGRIGQIGMVIGYNANEQTGNTEIDPLHIVEFETEIEGTIKEEFWYEEMTPMN